MSVMGQIGSACGFATVVPDDLAGEELRLARIEEHNCVGDLLQHRAAFQWNGGVECRPLARRAGQLIELGCLRRTPSRASSRWTRPPRRRAPSAASRPNWREVAIGRVFVNRKIKDDIDQLADPETLESPTASTIPAASVETPLRSSEPWQREKG